MRLFTLLLFSCIYFSSTGQGTAILDRDFFFEEGIYISLDDLKNNNPIAPSQIVKLVSNVLEDEELEEIRKEGNYAKSLGDGWEKERGVYGISWDEFKSYNPNFSIWLDGIVITDLNDSIIEIPIEELFAVSINKKMFVKLHKVGVAGGGGITFSSHLNKYFSKVYSKGGILLVADEGRNGIDMLRKATMQKYRLFSGDTDKVRPTTPLRKKKGEIKQYMVNLKNGDIEYIDERAVKELLINDKELYNLYKSTKGSRDILPYFIKKYNEKYPFYIYN